MINDEFLEWFRYHSSAFTGIPAWLKKTTSGPDAPTEKMILSRWFQVLKNIDLCRAKDATNKLHSGDEPEPKGFDRHPAAIKAIVQKNTAPKSHAPRIVNGEYCCDCLQCVDSGAIRIWHPVAVRAMREGTYGDPFTDYTAVVACKCKHGDQLRRHTDTFDAKRHCRIENGPKSEDVERLRQFAANRQPANYETAFAGYTG